MKLGQMQEIVSELCKLYGQLDSVNKAIIAFTDEQPAGWKSPLRVAKGEETRGVCKTIFFPTRNDQI